MNVLLLNSKSQGGGAVQATLRLHKGLLNAGVDSTLLVQQDGENNSSVVGPDSKLSRIMAPYRPFFDSIPVRWYRDQNKKSFSASWLPDTVGRQVRNLDPDLIHLNWVTGGFLQIQTIGEFNKPIVWTMHDMWPFTGGCHFSYGCSRYEDSCGNCPILQGDKEDDLSRKIWNRKRHAWADIDPILVAPSNWLQSCAEQSSLFKSCRVEHIPYGLDMRKYRNVDSDSGRKLFDLPPDRKIVLFGAHSSGSRKGYQHLEDALHKLQDRSDIDDVELAVFGSFDEPSSSFDFPIHKLGYLDQTRLKLAYAASEVLVIPSVQDNLPNVVLESMACGTPCVAFDIGGMSDMIDHGENGYLAEPFSKNDLVSGIMSVLHGNIEELSKSAREKIRMEFDIVDTVAQYQDLYKSII
jgi:glycosyltransferase involved in cell wall biosynthesis